MASGVTGSRGFGAMFSGKKAQLEGLQSKPAAKWPSIHGHARVEVLRHIRRYAQTVPDIKTSIEAMNFKA
jgi:hypothetical protein